MRSAISGHNAQPSPLTAASEDAPVLEGTSKMTLAKHRPALFALAALLANPATAADVVIEQVTVVSPQHATAQPKQNVLIRDGRIVSVGAKKPTAGPGATYIDGRARFLTPGIMDAHVHFNDAPGMPMVEDDPALNELRA